MSLFSKFHQKDLKYVVDKRESMQATELSRQNFIDREFFASYISYARKFVKPKISETVQMDIVQEYIRMRNLGNNKKTVTATPRQLESMIRLSESIAKMRLSDTVEKRDVEEAVRLIKQALQQSATDPTTGEINMDIITTGQTRTTSQRLKVLTDYITSIPGQFSEKYQQKGQINYGALLDLLQKKAEEGLLGEEKTVTEVEFRDALRVLEEDNVISIYGHMKAPKIKFVNPC